MRLTDTMIGHAAQVVREMLKFAQPADAVLSNFFRANRVDSRSRAFIAETAYTVLRRRRLLEKVVGERPTPLHLVLAALVKVTGLSQRQVGEALGNDGGREASWLGELKARAEPELTLAEQADLPDWLADRLLQHMAPAAVLELSRALNQPAPLDLRVNVMKLGRDEALARVLADGINAQPCRYAPQGIRVEGRPALSKYPLYLDGTLEVQDEGSQLLGHLLAPKRGEMVVDFCAGAGGKTLALGAMMRSTGRLYAFDVAEKRLARLKPRVARSGLSNVHPVLIAGENDTKVKRLAGKIDRVLVDAPCSGLGTLRRNPDLKWRQTPESVAELTRKQADILGGASRLLKPGGRLVYATCSILPEENEGIIDAFLATHPDFVRISANEILAKQGIVIDCAAGELDMKLAPNRHGTDGFYAAVLERRK
ncbi:RsmB/NOP family class I SAM-dependent RNA methyltransferase [Sulfurisoma sediminicola]|uniref:16S rRNA (Cytosine967-C5)-methyltransferase n=1 Tax=Sulfurisoma sediminicola TaxID=1381557 RepID=A0A497XJQ8_9PROT|nr:RsmB/NOP family class I SAM-dependent RNA methyltransferase [Sulfurisoma sediminicola]RLJ67496.1 16S rRNA (cytosine967-C5)-methyltransferase [Sulfurisoma sediminicola]